MIVNWVKEDEELLEPYEWQNGDDIEIISSMPYYLVDKQTLYDFIYGCLIICDKSLCNKIFALSNGLYCIAIETNQKGKLCYRSVFDYKDRDKLNKKTRALKPTTINYQKYDEAYIKEYGMTRKERMKKQYIEEKIDEYYNEDYESFLKLCKLFNIEETKSIDKYLHLKKIIEKGYDLKHEMLYQEIKNL